MTDRIRSEFERWATGREFPDLTQSMGRYNRAVVRWMWEAWQEQAERVADMAAALERAHNRQTGLLKQCHEHDARRAAAVAQAASLAAEVERLGDTERAIAQKLQDPASVYTAMLRGEIAKLTWRQMVHLSGPVPNTADEALAEIVRLRAEVKRLNETISRLSVEGQDAVEHLT